jgi:pimeloyl-ACP methyl ester carboxylesterase
MPEWETFFWSTGHLQDDAFMREVYIKLKAESGRAYFEMALWFLDKKRAAEVSPERITAPVLVISGHDDRIVRAAIGRRTAARFRDGVFVEIPNQDHMLPAGSGLPKVMAEFDRWIVDKKLSVSIGAMS